MKANVDNNREPWKSGYASLASATQLTYTMQGPFAQVSRVGDYDQNLAEWRNDMNAIWNFSRMWYFTGDTAYAQKAHDILLAWANTQTEFSGNESMLDLGDYAYKFVGGADILRGTWPGWTAADTTTVQAWFANVLQPGANPWGESMYGAANKGALALVAQGLMAIFNDDTVTLDRVTYQARTLAHVGLRSSNDIGMLGDSMRDQGHGQVQLFSLTMLAEALWKQGIDIYPDYNNRLLAAGEYYARVNDLSVATPFLPFGTTDAYYQTDVTNRGFHAGNTAFSILHNAYAVRKGIPAPWMARRLQEMPADFMFLKDADLSTATSAAAITIPAPTPITSGFSDADFGGASPAGSSSYSGGTWTVQGSGVNIWGSSDDCHFTYKAVTGDCAIIAKVESVQNTSQWARAGVMLRTSLSTGAPRVWMAVTPVSKIEQNIQGFAVYGGSNYGNKVAAGGLPQPSYWVKLERLGNIVTGSISQDGTNWAATEVGRLDNAPATWYV
ncbi:MAG TPA: alginate lyase family protein, partial [Roseimicrobium sp.]|nr:alginate lyase family protein [Roseimicrobium sp.]